MIEQQAKYVVRMLDEMDRRRVRTVDVSKPAQDSFQRRIQDKLHNGIWSTGGCTSWYLDAKGVNRTIWPGFTSRGATRFRVCVLSARFAENGATP